MTWDSETDLIFIFKIMKKGSIVKGKYLIGIFDFINYDECKIKFVKNRHISHVFPGGFIKLEDLKVPTKKEKEEYKKFLLKHGFSYYRGKVTKEL